MSEQKTCTKCGRTFEATSEFFARDSTKKDGLHPQCKLCAKAYYFANRDKLKEASKKWRAENPERFMEYQRTYYTENREKINERQKTWRAANRQSTNARMRKYYEEHKEQRAAYYLANRERILARAAARYAAKKAKQEMERGE